MLALQEVCRGFERHCTDVLVLLLEFSYGGFQKSEAFMQAPNDRALAINKDTHEKDPKWIETAM